MKIVIDIGNEHYERIMRFEEDVTVYPTTLALYEAVKNGTPLPEHHGRLIDADELKTCFPTCENSVDIKIASVRATIEYAPTIIEGSESE